ncbi:OPT oligopeptide transporter protein-domain-containing protein [Boletus edulis]|nr:OPT oligopeptide transporter protein-domain-containing protein [Boletus edulis]
MNSHGSVSDPDGYPRFPSVSNEKSLEKDETKADVGAPSSTPNDDASGIVLDSGREIATHVISVDDHPFLNPWTFRAFFLGLGLSTFGGSLGTKKKSKQTFMVSMMFLAIVSYILGFAMETFIPRRGLFRYYLNPHPFNIKENAFIVIMASAAANSALATDVLAVQRLYYNINHNAATSVLLLFSSQLLGYGIGGILRLRITSIFIWEIFPEWIFPLTGLSILCLSAPNNATVSHVFSGSNVPSRLKADYVVAYTRIAFDAHWDHIMHNFPFLSQLLFYGNGTIYDQLLIMNSNYEVTLVEQGLQAGGVSALSDLKLIGLVLSRHIPSPFTDDCITLVHRVALCLVEISDSNL